jgi:hypothetical protein
MKIWFTKHRPNTNYFSPSTRWRLCQSWWWKTVTLINQLIVLYCTRLHVKRFQNMSDSDGLIDLWRNAEFLICLKKTIPNVQSMTEFKGVRVMVFIATFNNISWQSVLLVEKTTDKRYHINVSSTPCHERDSNSQLCDCIGSCKSNYHDVPQVAIYNNDTWSGGYL